MYVYLCVCVGRFPYAARATRSRTQIILYDYRSITRCTRISRKLRPGRPRQVGFPTSPGYNMCNVYTSFQHNTKIFTRFSFVSVCIYIYIYNLHTQTHSRRELSTMEMIHLTPHYVLISNIRIMYIYKLCMCM